MENVYQKFYSAVSSLCKLSKTNDSADNIAAIDCFLSEFRNVTFVIKKNFSDHKYNTLYNELNDKYLRNDPIMKSLVDLRNEITKENPFDLVLKVDCIVYLNSVKKTSILDMKLNEEKISRTDIETKIKEKLRSLDFEGKEICFSYEFLFLSNHRNIDIMEYSKYGISIMYDFLQEFEKLIYGNTDSYKEIKTKIMDCIKKVYKTDLLLNFNCTYNKNDDVICYYPKAKIFLETKDKKIMDEFGKIPLNDDDLLLKGKNIEDRFRNFILTHVCIAQNQTEFLPTFFIIYSDGTYSIKPFTIYSKSDLYYIIDNMSKKVLTENIESIFVVQDMIGSSENLEDFKKMTHDQRMTNHNKEMILFSLLSKNKTIYILVDRDKLFNAYYIANITRNLKSNFHTSIFLPIINNFNKV